MNKMHSHVDLSVIVPVYKEASNIRPFLVEVEKTLSSLAIAYEVIFCLDPSPDDTESIIKKEIERNQNIKLIVFSRRFGQPAATMAGLLNCQGKSAVVIDVDLQDPPDMIISMYHKLQEGYEVVYAKRRTRKGETIFKKMISYVGYYVIAKCSDIDIPKNTGDFRIMTRRIIEELRKLNESHGFLRGLVAYVGFKQIAIEYDRDERYSGLGNYNRLTGSLKIGLNGLISFSSRPLQIMSLAGSVLATLSFILGAWYVLQKLIGMKLTAGLSTTILIITFFSGIQLLCLGLMGEYIARIYDETKRRPMFIIDKIYETKL
jgi:glycosyltransferase involved in cell wall biosynthesis